MIAWSEASKPVGARPLVAAAGCALALSLLLPPAPSAQAVAGARELAVPVAPEPLLSSVRAIDLTADAEADVETRGVAVTRFFAFADGTSEEDVRVAVQRMSPGTELTVEVDGVRVGTITTDAEGDGVLFLSTHPAPGAQALPVALVPVTTLRRVSVHGGATEVRLEGDMVNAARRFRLHTPDNPIGD